MKLAGLIKMDKMGYCHNNKAHHLKHFEYAFYMCRGVTILQYLYTVTIQIHNCGKRR